MTTIKISDLSPTVSQLFSDSESYLNDLSKNELNSISGGVAPLAWGIGILWVNRAIVAGALLYTLS